jgi:hypothetical protein
MYERVEGKIDGMPYFLFEYLWIAVPGEIPKVDALQTFLSLFLNVSLGVRSTCLGRQSRKIFPNTHTNNSVGYGIGEKLVHGGVNVSQSLF